MPITGASGATGLATARLALRPVAESDIDEIARLAGDLRVAQWTARIPHPLAGEDVAAWCAGLTAAGSGPGERAFAMRRKGAAALVGVSALTVAGEEGRGEIGYWVGHAYWGHGYATEAVRRLVVFGFRDLRLARIEAPVFAGNARSARVLEKAGFEARGHRTVDAPARGAPRDAVIYRMERADFARVALSQAVGRQ